MARHYNEGSEDDIQLGIAEGSNDGTADGFENGSWLGFELLGIEEG